MEVYKTAADEPQEITLPERADILTLVGLISRMCIGNDVTVEGNTTVTLGVAQSPEFYDDPHQPTCIYETRIGNAVVGAGAEITGSTIIGYYDSDHLVTLGEGNVIESATIIGNVTLGDRNHIGEACPSRTSIENIGQEILTIGDDNFFGNDVIIEGKCGGSLGTGNYIENSQLIPLSIGSNNSIAHMNASGAEHIIIGNNNSVGGVKGAANWLLWLTNPLMPNRFEGNGIVIGDNVEIRAANTFFGSVSKDGDGLVIPDNTVIGSHQVVVGPEHSDSIIVMTSSTTEEQ